MKKASNSSRQTRAPLALQPGRCAREDYEYKRAGARNIFVAVEPKGGFRKVTVTAQRKKADFVGFIQELLSVVFPAAAKIHLVLDNLNTHFRQTFVDVLGEQDAEKLLRRVVFHYTPKHGSWLNMAEMEIRIMDTECTGRRFGSEDSLQSEVQTWQYRRNREKRGIEWTFTRQDADRKLSRHYVA